MKKFRSLKSYFKMMDEFIDEEDSVFVKRDIEEFVGNDKFWIYDMISEGLNDEDVMFIRGKYYSICERFEGCEFVEISKDDFECMCEF